MRQANPVYSTAAPVDAPVNELLQSTSNETQRLVAPARAAARPLPNDAALAKGFRDLEGSIRDLKTVVATVALLFDSVLDYQRAEKKPPGYLRFTIPAHEHDCLLYAIEHARGLAGDLTKAYDAGYEQASREVAA